MRRPPSRPQLLYFCDETGTVDQEYLTVGGVAIQAQRASEIRRDLTEIKAQCNVTREIKWSNTRDRRDNVHKAFVDYLFSLIQNNLAYLHLRFSEMAAYDHNLSGRRKKIDTVSKAYFQLLLHRPGQHYCEKCEVFVYPDKGECTELLPSFLGRLNDNCRDKYGHGSFRHIEPRDSNNDVILQMVDVTIGALGAVRNNRHIAADVAPAKRALALYVLSKTSFPSLGFSSSKEDRRLSIWNASPQWEKMQRPRR